MPSGIANVVLRGAAWSTVGGVTSRAFTVLVGVLAARILSQTDFGAFGLVQSSIGMFLVFASFGLSSTASRYIAASKEADKNRCGSIVALATSAGVVTGLVFSLALLLAAQTIATSYLESPALTHPLMLASLLLFFNAVNGAAQGALAGFHRYREQGIANIIAGALSAPGVAVGAHVGGVSGAILGLCGAACANCLLSFAALRRTLVHEAIPRGWGDWRSNLPPLLGYSLPATLAAALWAPINWYGTAEVTRVHGLAETGVYSAANQLFLAVAYLPALLGQVLLPVFAEQIHMRATRAEANRLLRAATLAYLAAAIGVATILSVLSPWLMSLFGPRYAQHWDIALTMIWSAALAAVQTPANQYLAAADAMWWRLGANGVWCVIYLGLLHMLIQDGAIGASVARLVAYSVQTLLFIALAYAFATRERRLDECLD